MLSHDHLKGLLALVIPTKGEARHILSTCHKIKLLEWPGEGRCYHGRFDDVPVIIFLTGVGMEVAGKRFKFFLDYFQSSEVIHLGLAGSLRDDWPVGTTVQVTEVIDEQSGNILKLPLLQPNVKNSQELFCGRSVTCCHVVKTQDEHQRIVGMFNADVVEMESYVIAKECLAAGIKFLIFRVVSDFANESSENHFFDNLRELSVRLEKLLKMVLSLNNH